MGLVQQAARMGELADAAAVRKDMNVDEFQGGVAYGQEVAFRLCKGMIEAAMESDPVLRVEDAG